MNIMSQKLMQTKTYKQICGGFNMCVFKKKGNNRVGK